MTTIADRLNEWVNREIRGATVMTKDTEAYNHMIEAVERLKAEPWATLVLGADLNVGAIGGASGKDTTVDGGAKLNT